MEDAGHMDGCDVYSGDLGVVRVGRASGVAPTTVLTRSLHRSHLPTTDHSEHG
jgi:hypothetical protein